MSTYIIAVRMSPTTASDHQHISEVRYEQPGTIASCDTRTMVNHIRQGNKVFVHGFPDAQVWVVDVNPPYLRTFADGVWSNNLLSLPRF